MTAISEVSICNLALQKLGAAAITALTQNHPSARAMNACYETIRDRELRAHRWNFAKTRATLAPHATAPASTSGFAKAFPLPSDYLLLLSYNESNLGPGRNDIDWKIENHQGVRCILTNDGDSLPIVYIARVTDPTLFDAIFVDALACKLAWHTCEQITQSNTKKADIHSEYLDSIREARRFNAIENQPTEPPEDTWISARR